MRWFKYAVLTAILTACGSVFSEQEMPQIADDYKSNMILNTCLWKADVAQGAQMAIQEYPGRTPEEHTAKLNYLLKDQPKWYAQKIMDIFRDVFLNYSPQVSSSKVFYETYNGCVIQAKADIENGMDYPAMPPELAQEREPAIHF
jgi:hypothetical protein